MFCHQEHLQFSLCRKKGQNTGDESCLTPPLLQPFIRGARQLPFSLLPVGKAMERAGCVLHLLLLPRAALDPAGEFQAWKGQVQIAGEQKSMQEAVGRGTSLLGRFLQHSRLRLPIPTVNI